MFKLINKKRIKKIDKVLEEAIQGQFTLISKSGDLIKEMNNGQLFDLLDASVRHDQAIIVLSILKEINNRICAMTLPQELFHIDGILNYKNFFKNVFNKIGKAVEVKKIIDQWQNHFFDQNFLHEIFSIALECGRNDILTQIIEEKSFNKRNSKSKEALDEVIIKCIKYERYDLAVLIIENAARIYVKDDYQLKKINIVDIDLKQVNANLYLQYFDGHYTSLGEFQNRTVDSGIIFFILKYYKNVFGEAYSDRQYFKYVQYCLSTDNYLLLQSIIDKCGLSFMNQDSLDLIYKDKNNSPYPYIFLRNSQFQSILSEIDKNKLNINLKAMMVYGMDMYRILHGLPPVTTSAYDVLPDSQLKLLLSRIENDKSIDLERTMAKGMNMYRKLHGLPQINSSPYPGLRAGSFYMDNKICSSNKEIIEYTKNVVENIKFLHALGVESLEVNQELLDEIIPPLPVLKSAANIGKNETLKLLPVMPAPSCNPPGPGSDMNAPIDPIKEIIIEEIIEEKEQNLPLLLGDAIKANNFELAKTLIKQISQSKIEDKSSLLNKTLHDVVLNACKIKSNNKNNVMLIRKLIKAGADSQQIDQDGYSLVGIAIVNRNTGLARALVKQGVPVSEVIINLAEEYKCPKLKTWLQNYRPETINQNNNGSVNASNDNSTQALESRYSASNRERTGHNR